MNKKAMLEIMEVLCRHQVPLQHTVALLCKAKGVPLNEIAKQVGCHRNLVYKSLAGEVAPNPQLVQGLREVLGLDPWAFRQKMVTS